MPLAWNEIRHRAIKFSNEWTKTESESADKQTFWNEFFEVFGVARKTVASFEAPVRKVSGHDGFIDLFWKGMLIVEHKSRGGNLSKAQSQAFDYIQGLATEGKHKEIPRWVIVSDFARVVLYDLEPEDQQDLPLFNNRRVAIVAEFALHEFHKNIRPFAFIAGYKQQKLDPEDPANLEAAKMMADLHDALKAGGYTGHELRQFLVRILFCLFAEDTGIFPQPRMFELYIVNHTAPDGSDLGLRLARLFEILNTPEHKRQLNLDADLKEFPYINGDLFKEHLSFADFNSDMRNALLACCAFRWEKISPAVFGSLFQEVMLAPERRQLGAHYTAEKNIMKVVRSLFLDDLREEFDRIKQLKIGREKRLDEFHGKLSKLTFFDPACGCGNFLVITYRELRALELEILLLKYGKQHEMALDEVTKLSQLDVDQMYGIEYEEFPARIAEVALWLTDHQMNVRLSEAFSQFYLRIPLRKSPHIHVGNALRKDWKEVIPPEKCSYILGNPPFVGKTYQTDEQKVDMELACGEVPSGGLLDYVTGWYFKAARHITGTKARVAFVSTNSISQGEQPGIMWADLFHKFKLKIHFAHRTFPWQSEARGKAHVHVVIIGFAAYDVPTKYIYEYDADPNHAAVTPATNINPYLVAGSDIVLNNRNKPICQVPEITNGNKQVDGGFLTLTEAEKLELAAAEPIVAKYIRPFLGSDELINGGSRWCLWLLNAAPEDIRTSAELKRRIEGVRQFRLESKKAATQKDAATPSLFAEIRYTSGDYLAIPEVSSERRPYIPIGYLDGSIIPSNKIQVLSGATTFHFGVLSSAMHMAWVREVTGRLESRFSYSARIVYNNFPWPQTPTPEQKERVEAAAQAVLDARAQFPNSTLADLYDPVAMPPVLAKAHAELDRAVDRCYRKEPFPSDRARVEFLFKLYEQLTAPLVAAANAKPKGAKRKAAYAKSPPQPSDLTPEKSFGDAAHFYSAKEEGATYQTETVDLELSTQNSVPSEIEFMKVGDTPDEFTQNVLLKAFTDYSVALGRRRDGKVGWLGSGVLVKKGNRYGILTAHHCLHACSPEVRIGSADGDTFYFVLNRGRAVVVKSEEMMEHPLATPVFEEYGPDLTFIEILSVDRLSTFRAVGTFWSLDRDVTEIRNAFGTPFTPIVSIGYPEVHHDTIKSGNMTRLQIRHMVYDNAIKQGDVTERNGWDYLDTTISYAGNSSLPISFAGLSGGPVWAMELLKSRKDGKLRIGKFALVGITFYQIFRKDDEGRLRAHFIKSIYDLAWKSLV